MKHFKLIKKIGDVLFVMVFVSLLIPFIIANFVLGDIVVFGRYTFYYSYVFLFFLPIPFLAIVFGIVTILKNTPSKKNVIAGSIVFLLMLLFGLTALQNKPYFSKDFFVTTSQSLEVYFPSSVKIMWEKLDSWTAGDAKILSQEEENIFTSQITSNKWIDELPEYYDDFLIPHSEYFGIKYYDYFCLRVFPTNEYNPTYLASGEYDVSLVAYYSQNHQIFMFSDYHVVVG